MSTPETSERDSDYTRVSELINRASIAIITTENDDGRLVSRPMAPQQRDFDGDLWFFTEDPSNKTDEVRAHPQVNVALESGKGWVSVSGPADIVTDQAKIDEFWTAGAKAWFENGRADPAVALLKVHAQTAEYWSADDPKPVALLKVAKAAATGGRPDIGENGIVTLDE